jgi:hypothetical protein
LSIKDVFIDNDNNKWFNTSQGIYQYNDSLKKIVVNPFKIMSKHLIQNILIDKNGIVWFSSSGIVFRFDKKVKYSIDCKFYPLIRKVTIAKDSIIYSGYSKKDSSIVNNTKIEFKNNSISFEYTYPDYNSEEDNKFKYFLQGFDEEWSEWSYQTKKEYTNLREGTYYFRVKAKNVYDYESGEFVYKFTISPPWYRTIIAFIVYFILIALIIYQYINFKTLRLKNEKHKLKRGIKIAVEELEQQKEELRSQTETLVEIRS